MTLIQQTVYRKGTDTIETVNGIMSWSHWLKKEWGRYRGIKGRHAVIRANKRGETALFVNEVAKRGID